jgi:uncharacterized protein (DUF427 family)
VIDAWFEEDQQIYDHPKNPYTRIDILPSSRKITVKIGGEVIADSSNPRFLFETGLRTRFYLPKTSVSPVPTSVCTFGGCSGVDENRSNGNTFQKATLRANVRIKDLHSITM